MADPDASTDTDVGSDGDSDEPPYRVALAPLFETIGSIDGRGFEAAIAGGLAGGFQAALLIQLYDTDAIRRVGAAVGTSTLDGGWLAMFALGTLVALPFHVLASLSTDAFVSRVMDLSSRHELLRRLLVPLLRRSAFTTAMVGLGNAYGVAVGVVVSLFVLPIWLTVTASTPAAVPDHPAAVLVEIIAWTVYGGTLGLVYGLVLDQ
ncbi:hypothetical protein [Natrinema salsiterrestre]|uniref:Uncharacterized protein n=1 Tax=Natrinema salsiterrestre TaxID=2950540 RepID=A0A9Q4PZK1_9EURY|nr:hypothetical protein [Natrinema salsiterrestre]MDF9744374.1 hypothetical protein [Natrinema salsiterrestre]